MVLKPLATCVCFALVLQSCYFRPMLLLVGNLFQLICLFSASRSGPWPGLWWQWKLSHHCCVFLPSVGFLVGWGQPSCRDAARCRNHSSRASEGWQWPRSTAVVAVPFSCREALRPCGVLPCSLPTSEGFWRPSDQVTPYRLAGEGIPYGTVGKVFLLLCTILLFSELVALRSTQAGDAGSGGLPKRSCLCAASSVLRHHVRALSLTLEPCWFTYKARIWGSFYEKTERGSYRCLQIC